MTAKEQMMSLLVQQPDDSSFDELLKELAFSRMVERGLADSKAGRVFPAEEVQRKIDSWAK